MTTIISAMPPCPSLAAIKPTTRRAFFSSSPDTRRLTLADAQLESLLRAMRSNLELSLTRLLRTAER